ncbi:MAG TPA: SDR family NAD(P)-dependent oxidoreductase, partial [Ktedonobacteraceae bacterium]
MKVLIIGATSAIAQETAKCFAREGAELFLVARSDNKLSAIASDLKVRGARCAETATLDVNDFAYHQTILERATLTLDGLDMLLIAHGTL